MNKPLSVFVLVDNKNFYKESLVSFLPIESDATRFIFLVKDVVGELIPSIKEIFQGYSCSIYSFEKYESSLEIIKKEVQVSKSEVCLFLHSGDYLWNKHFPKNITSLCRYSEIICGLLLGGNVQGKYVKTTDDIIYKRPSGRYSLSSFLSNVYFEEGFLCPSLFDGFFFKVEFLKQAIEERDSFLRKFSIFTVFQETEIFLWFAPLLYRRLQARELLKEKINKLQLIQSAIEGAIFEKNQIDANKFMRELKFILRSTTPFYTLAVKAVIRFAYKEGFLEKESTKWKVFFFTFVNSAPSFITELLIKILSLRYRKNIHQDALVSNSATNYSSDVAYLHKRTFGKFRGENRGKEVALIATGPSLKHYKKIEGAKYLGVNKVIEMDELHLDYYFLQDISGAADYVPKILSRNKNHIQKFFGRLKDYRKIPQNTIPVYFEDLPNSQIYFTSFPNHLFNRSIDIFPLTDFGSVVFSAFSFLLWTRPKIIYLVGCDCTSGYFDGKPSTNFTNLKRGWVEAKLFLDCYYPDVRVVTINPQGLKGFFVDEYQ